MDFVHLHVHSHYSLLTGLPKIKELVKAAKTLGFKALALTDYGSMYGAIQFYEKCKEEGIQPIIGCEVFVAPHSRFDKRPKIDTHAHHLVLLAETFEGYQNLMRISSVGHLEGFYYRPRVDKEILTKFHKGIIALSGCMGGEVPQLIHNGAGTQKIDDAIKAYQEIFGENNFFLELQDHPEKEGQVEVNHALIAAAQRTGASLVVTRDVHYLHNEDKEAQDVLTCIKDGRTLDAPGRFSLRHVDRSLNSSEDIASRFAHIPEALHTTVAIANRCVFEIPLDTWHFPKFELPVGTTPESALHDLAKAGFTMRYGDGTEELHTRFEYELGVINQRGFAPYFLAVADYIAWAKQQRIITTTRGSAAGSLISYCIGITNIDPIAFKLPFERFLNPFRPSPPDVDVDFADYRRDEVIKYVTEKYGTDKVAQICTFGTMAARASIRDVGRALGYAYGMVDAIAKLVPFGSQGFPMTIAHALKVAPEFADAYRKNAEVTRMVNLAQKIEGCARHVSVHAAGVVIAPLPLTDFTPLQREPGGDKIITQYEMRSVEKAGVLKMDFLGLRNLSILEEAIRYVHKTKGVEIKINELSFDDKKTYAMLGRGETMGVFQLASPGMTRYLKELKPSVITDLMAMVALYRPGPMETIPAFISRKHDASHIRYLDPRMKEYLDASYGLLTYQDDVLLTAIHIAGYTWGAADKLRKAMGKKIPEEMAKQKEKFIDGAIRNGAQSDVAIALWQLIEPFAAYGFNKAHAASYAVIAYYTAWMKAHYPAEYMAALLSCESGDMDTVALNIAECRRMHIPVLPPAINESFELFGVTYRVGAPVIRFGLGAIKNVGEHIARVIIEERKKNGPYSSFEDFLIRVRDKDLNKKSLESLIKTGAFDACEDRGILLGNIENILKFSHEVGALCASQQSTLFGDMRSFVKLRFLSAPSVAAHERLFWEKELLGLFVTAHPMADVEPLLDNRVMRCANVSTTVPGHADRWVCVMGIVQTHKKMVTKKGEMMAFITLEDSSGSSECVLFPKLYATHGSEFVPGSMVAILGKRDTREDVIKILVERCSVCTKETAALVINQLFEPLHEIPTVDSWGEAVLSQTIVGPALLLTIATSQLPQLSVIKTMLAERPGPYKVFMKVGALRHEKIITTGLTTSVSEALLNSLKSSVGETAVQVIE